MTESTNSNHERIARRRIIKALKASLIVVWVLATALFTVSFVGLLAWLLPGALMPVGNGGPAELSLEYVIERGDMSFERRDYAEADHYYRRALGEIDGMLNFETTLSEPDVKFTDRLRKKKQIVAAKSEIALLGTKIVRRQRGRVAPDAP